MTRGVPKQDGSGRGRRANRGRGGCGPPEDRGLKVDPGKRGYRNRRKLPR